MNSTWAGFRSVLAPSIHRYLEWKRALGRQFMREERVLRLLDRYLVTHRIRRRDRITSRTLDGFLASRPRPRPRSYNELLGDVRRLFEWMVLQGEIRASPLAASARRVTSRRIPFLFDSQQARAVIDAAAELEDEPRATMRGPTFQLVFSMLFGLGLRVGEVAGLDCGDVDHNQSVLVIRRAKFKKTRLVPFGPRMGSLLVAYRESRLRHGLGMGPADALFSFAGYGRRISTNTIRNNFHQIISKIDLHVPRGTSTPRVHDLRHSFAVGALVRWYRAGISPGNRLQHLSTFMGHVDPASTAVYLAITSELLNEANRRFEGFAATRIEVTL